MKHLLFLLLSFALTASVNVASANSVSDGGRAAAHSALVDMPKAIDLSGADPTTWPVTSTSPALPRGKAWRYFEQNR